MVTIYFTNDLTNCYQLRQPQGVTDRLIIAGISCLVAQRDVWQMVHFSNDATLGDCGNCLWSGWSQSLTPSFLTSQLPTFVWEHCFLSTISTDVSKLHTSLLLEIMWVS